MFFRIFKKKYMTKIALFSTSSFIYWSNRMNRSDDIYLLAITQIDIKVFSKILFQWQNNWIRSSFEKWICSQVFENTINYSINKWITVRNNNPQNTTITILVQSLEISKYEIASNAFVLGTDEQSLKEFQQCSITDSNFTLDISLGEELQIKPFLYFDEWMLFQSRKSCLNKNGELLGIISGKFKNKTQVVPTTYFQGLENGRNLVKAYLGLSLNTYNKGSTFIIKINLKVLQRRQVQKLGEIIQCIDGVTIQHCKDVTKVVNN